jgi:hypothetical protein
MHYAVLNLANLALVYRGNSEGGAAAALEPNHVYGRGETSAEAFADAMRRVGEQQAAIKN